MHYEYVNDGLFFLFNVWWFIGRKYQMQALC